MTLDYTGYATAMALYAITPSWIADGAEPTTSRCRTMLVDRSGIDGELVGQALPDIGFLVKLTVKWLQRSALMHLPAWQHKDITTADWGATADHLATWVFEFGSIATERVQSRECRLLQLNADWHVQQGCAERKAECDRAEATLAAIATTGTAESPSSGPLRWRSSSS